MKGLPRRPHLGLTVRCAGLLSMALAIVFGCGAPALGQSGVATSGPRSDVASYQIHVELDPTSKQLKGTERLSFSNPSPDTLNEVWLRLYLNAFRSQDTPWMREAAGGHRGFAADAPGWIRLDRLSLGDGEQLPVPEEAATETIVRLPLPVPLGPGQVLSLDIEWTAQLPAVFARTGFADDFVMAGQWYPKLAVYDRGRWDAEEWHANSEFFADFGNYDLAITVPRDHVTGASGVRVDEAESSDGKKTVRYRAERVTDVAWTAWPGYLVHDRAVNAAGTTTQVELLVPPAEEGNVERHFAAITAALDSIGTWYGAYPWPKLTVVVPPDNAGGAGGMEYPTLVTTGGSGVPPETLPWLEHGIRVLEAVTIHEIAHQWFPMQVQSNEATEAWLDEGFADYLTTRVLGRLYAGDRSYTDLGVVRIGYENQQRGVLALTDAVNEPLAQPAWQLQGFNTYAATVYAKGSLALLSLERLVGEEEFTRALRHYTDLWRWRHPTSGDLQAALEESTGDDFEWFVQAFVFGDDVVDFAVVDLGQDGVAVVREGDAPYPVDVLVRYADGSSQTLRLEPNEERLDLREAGRSVVSVSVDPEERVALEIDRLDNSRALAPDLGATLSLSARWLALVQQILQWLGQLG